MAEVFERSSAILTTQSETLVYQAPNNNDGDRAILLSCLAANTDGASEATISVRVTAANDALISRTAHQITVPAKATLELMPNRLILRRGEKVKAQASLPNRIDITVSALELRN